jgi:acyl-CoA thioesterase-1
MVKNTAHAAGNPITRRTRLAAERKASRIRIGMTALIGGVAAIGIGSLLTATVFASATSDRSMAVHLSASPSAVPTETATPTAEPSPTVTVTPTPAPIPVPVAPPAPLQVLTIGDSVMKGYGLTPGSAWPDLIPSTTGWNVTSKACDGAGFIAPGSPEECGDTFGAVIRSASALTPDVVIIQGSSNDFGQSNAELLTATYNAVNAARSAFPKADIIGLSTLWSESQPPSQLADTNSQVRQAVTAVGGHYLDIGQPLGGHPELMQDDDVHPTAAGQRVLATAIQSAVAEEQQETAAEAQHEQELKHEQEVKLALELKLKRQLKMMSRWIQ